MKRLLLYSGATVAAVIVLAVLVVGSGYLYSLRLTAPADNTDNRHFVKSAIQPCQLHRRHSKQSNPLPTGERCHLRPKHTRTCPGISTALRRRHGYSARDLSLGKTAHFAFYPIYRSARPRILHFIPILSPAKTLQGTRKRRGMFRAFSHC